MRCISLATFLIVFFSWTSVVAQSGKCGDQKGEDSTESSLPATLYQEWRMSPAPAHGKWVDVNPPALLWPSEKKNNNQDVSYRIFLSKDAEFPESTTLVSDLQKFCFYNPHKKLEPGVWHWKYEIIGKNGISRSPGTYAFIVSNETPVFETPVFEEVLARINTKHPRIMNQGHTMEQIRKKAPLHPLYKSILQEGEKALKAEIYKGPVTDKNPAAARSLAKTAGNEVERYHHLLEAYVLSGNKQMLTALLARTRIFLSWPTDDLLGSKVLSALAVGYDLLYDELSNDVKAAMLTVIANQIEEGLAHWPGFIEARQVENHFWQMELAGNYIAALATVHDLPVASRMLEYTYELFFGPFSQFSDTRRRLGRRIGLFQCE